MEETATISLVKYHKLLDQSKQLLKLLELQKLPDNKAYGYLYDVHDSQITILNDNELVAQLEKCIEKGIDKNLELGRESYRLNTEIRELHKKLNPDSIHLPGLGDNVEPCSGVEKKKKGWF